MNILVTNEGLDQVVSGLFQFKQGLEFESLCMQQPSLGDSPTISSRPCLIPLFTNQFNAGHHPSPHLELTNAKQSTVFWRNWKRQNHKSNHQFDDDADADADAPSSSWVQDDSLSDARNGPIPKVTCIYPTFALLPSYSGAGTQILSLQQWQSRGSYTRYHNRNPPRLLAMLALRMPPLLHSSMVMMRWMIPWICLPVRDVGFLVIGPRDPQNIKPCVGIVALPPFLLLQGGKAPAFFVELSRYTLDTDVLPHSPKSANPSPCPTSPSIAYWWWWERRFIH
ncbi:hypothetical protein SLEP1_g56076 [Rubroshorea leprosula]|uniref:Uncharacterized protein n=1 Tax=Rubroshorea leprosula TaxID=152421 RepID=A0AAV5MHF4_9ROSI|nr:hypothetical protein SLEP1_g56076 [Rubroshorea leprosula]